VFVALMLLQPGCVNRLARASIGDPDYRSDLEARVKVPAGWTAQPTDRGSNYVTQVWISPTGDTALGVIRFTLPLPVGHEWALWGFLQNMRRSEGRADLIEKNWDESAQALRFVAQGGRYRVRSKLMVEGVRGWSVFAGTLTDRAVNEPELEIAEQARESVRVEK
jgi:hypothetical protein